MRRPVAAAVALVAIASLPLPAGAHSQGTSYSEIRLRSADATVELRVTRLDLSRLPFDPWSERSARAPLVEYLTDHLQLRRGGISCPLRAPAETLGAPEGWLALRWEVSCPQRGALELESQLFAEVAPGHLHFARVLLPDGNVQERVLSDRDRVWRVSRGEGALAPTVSEAAALGARVLATDPRCLALAVALSLLAATPRDLGLMIGALALGQSLALAPRALGLVAVANGPARALLGFAVLVAAAYVLEAVSSARALRAFLLAALACAWALTAAAAGRHPALSSGSLAGLALFCACHFSSAAPARARRERPPLGLALLAAAPLGLLLGGNFSAGPPPGLAPALLGFNASADLAAAAIAVAGWGALRGLRVHSGAALERSTREIAGGALAALGLVYFVGALAS